MNKVKNMAYWKSKNQSSKSDFVDLTKKTGLGPRVKESEVDHMKNTTLQEVLHNKHADKTEGTIEEQAAYKNDPSAPGFRSMDAGSYIKGKQLRKKKN